METDGNPYLHAPDEELSWLVLHSADVVAFALALLLAAGAALVLGMRAALQGLPPHVAYKIKLV